MLQEASCTRIRSQNLGEKTQNRHLETLSAASTAWPGDSAHCIGNADEGEAQVCTDGTYCECIGFEGDVWCSCTEDKVASHTPSQPSCSWYKNSETCSGNSDTKIETCSKKERCCCNGFEGDEWCS